jgi:UDP-GlcNAc:undecaprenyl-phosphate GlcNAc-1-phosphate transferase
VTETATATVAVAAACTALVAAAAALVLWRTGGPWLRDTPSLQRRNWAGRSVPVSGGVVVATGATASLAIAAVVVPLFVPAAAGWSRTSVLPVASLVVGFAFLGLVDDLIGDDGAKGFRGHLRALANGRLTTGMVKLAGGAAIAVVVTAASSPGQGAAWLGDVLGGAAVVALGANLANLLDRAPGRLGKASLLTGLPLLVVALLPFAAGSDAPGAAVAVAAPFGATWAMLPADQRERLMLGDTGANVVGAVAGWLAAATVVAGFGTAGLWTLVVVLVGANGLSEFVSFSRIIDAVPPLRALDRWGRLPASAPGDDVAAGGRRRRHGVSGPDR